MKLDGDSMARAPVDMSERELCAAIWPNGRAPVKHVRCQHCGRRNRVNAGLAATAPERQYCGACQGRLFLRPDEPLSGLSPLAYQHSLDRRSIAAIRSIPGAAEMLRKVLEYAADRTAHLIFMADSIRCEEDQFPELIALVDKARKSLDVPYRPTVFLGESPYMNAMTTGVQAPLIVVQSALLDQMTDREMIAILGHELGHLQTDHPLYQSAARLLLQSAAGASHTVRMLSMPLWRILLHWSRCAELTADRAALLASRDLGACIGMMLTFAGGNRPGTTKRTKIQLAPFIRQCRELVRVQRSHSFEGLLSSYMSLGRTHPHMAFRVMHLIQWVEHGRYLNILSGEYCRQKAAHPHDVRARDPQARAAALPGYWHDHSD
jgi:Zn-dependent protease with chaperone function